EPGGDRPRARRRAGHPGGPVDSGSGADAPPADAAADPRVPGAATRSAGRATRLVRRHTRLIVAASDGRANVLVAVEEVGRVVLVLQRHQPVIARAVGIPNPIGAFDPTLQVVDVGPAGHAGPHGVEEGPRPGNVFVRLGGFGPPPD